ncbi:MAG: isochorismatase family cysteine hydrolase [Pseudomonadota bacterium]
MGLGTQGKEVWDRWSKVGESVRLARPAREQRLIELPAKPDDLIVDLAMSAFIIVDMQNDFLHPDGWFAKVRGADVAPLMEPLGSINTLSDAFRRAAVPVIHVNWGVRPDAANLPANVVDKASECGRQIGYADEMDHGPVLAARSWGSQSVQQVRIETADYQVFKHRLSGFRDNELDQLLRRLGVSTIFYAGVNLDRCVFATLMDGCFQGYDAILVEDACATASPEPMATSIIKLIHMLYGFTASSADIVAAAGAPNLSPSLTSKPKEGAL